MRVASPKARARLSRQTLDLVPPRALAFLRAAGLDADIQAALAGAGFAKKDLAEGWRLLREASGAWPDVVPRTIPNPAVAATTALEAWARSGLVRARAALARSHPDQAAFVFESRRLPRGPVATVTEAMIFVDRCDALAKSPGRRKSRRADQAALDTLAARGLGAAERERVRSLLRSMMGVGAAPARDAELAIRAIRRDAQARLIDLHGWLQEWSETARAVIKRRDQLIRLGIGKRRVRPAT